MDTPYDPMARPPGPSRSAKRVLSLAVGLTLLAVGLALGFWLGGPRAQTVSRAAPEVGFARAMAAHHAQAVDMAVLLRERSEDPEMRQLALDILLTQQAQIGQMRGWLAVWGQPQASTEPAMAWMGMPTMGQMPGMASSEQLAALRAAQGTAADGLFLQLMIPHHQAGVSMAQAILALDPPPPVRSLAQSIVASQQSEIAYMQALLEQKGFSPESAAPDNAPNNMGP